jgi:hypothetical protein
MTEWRRLELVKAERDAARERLDIALARIVDLEDELEQARREYVALERLNLELLDELVDERMRKARREGL